jgi:cyanophycin synthetase
MIEAKQIDGAILKSTHRTIRDEALKRGWQVWFHEPRYSFIRLIRPDGKVLELFSATPPSTSYTAAKRADDKYMTTQVYAENDLPVPPTILIQKGEEKMEEARQLLAMDNLVVKPLDSGHGNGVTINISSEADYLAALQTAREFSDTVLVQHYLENATDIRLTCINYRLEAALIRVPSRVKGDGVHTIRQLIEQENQSPDRGIDYNKALNVIDIKKAALFLGEVIETTPEKDAWVQVIGTANVGSGGETIDCTDDIPAWLQEMAEKAARVAELPVCGVDFLVRKTPESDDTIEELKPVIIEVNKCPALFIHEPATTGKFRPVTAAYLDYLATL